MRPDPRQTYPRLVITWGASRSVVVKSKSKLSQRPIRQKVNIKGSLQELRVNMNELFKTGKFVSDQIAIG